MANYMSAAKFVAKMKKKHGANPVWVWDELKENFNIIKGLGCWINGEEMKIAEQIIIDGLAGVF